METDEEFLKKNFGEFSEILFQTSSKVLLENPDDFLKSFVVRDFYDQKFVDYIIAKSKSFRRIGEQSSVGQLYLIDDYAVKYSNLCGSSLGFLGKLCEKARLGNLIFQVPSSYDNKNIMMAPNYITESIIGILLSSEKIRKHTAGFPRTFGFQYDAQNTEIYTIMEKLDQIKDKLFDEKNILYTIFSIAATLNTSQKLHKYTHYDLHSGNFMSRKKSGKEVYVYQLNNGKYMYTLFNYTPVLIDFGFNRMETNDIIITPNTQLQLPLFSQILSVHNYYGFNPYYDMFTFLYIFSSSNQTKKDVNLEKEWWKELMSGFLNIDKKDLKEAIDRILILPINSPNSWRPNPNELEKYDPEKGIYPPCTPEDFMTKISFIVQDCQPNFTTVDEVVTYLQTSGLVVLDYHIDLSVSKYIEKMTFFPLPKNTPKMDTTFYPTRTVKTPKISNIYPNVSKDFISLGSSEEGPLVVEIFDPRTNKSFPKETRKTIKDFNRVVSTKSSLYNTLGNQYVHIAKIKQKEAKLAGYKWSLDCCRIDIRNYMRDTKIKAGIAINGSFFRHDNFSPIGSYKTKDILSFNPIPKSNTGESYEEDYGIIGITREGIMEIVKNTDKVKIRKFSSFLSSGPILVWNNYVIPTDDELGRSKRFQCGDETILDGMPCKKTTPGQLHHSSIPIPRSAIGIKENGDVFFIYVEGFDSRGMGMDLSQLAKLCKDLGAKKALNLDGGLSSQLIWRVEGEEVVYQTNPDHDFTYPVGNIISMVKM